MLMNLLVLMLGLALITRAFGMFVNSFSPFHMSRASLKEDLVTCKLWSIPNFFISSREAGYTATNQAIHIKQAEKNTTTTNNKKNHQQNYLWYKYAGRCTSDLKTTIWSFPGKWKRVFIVHDYSRPWKDL